jgi:hypothetical protein
MEEANPNQSELGVQSLELKNAKIEEIKCRIKELGEF